VTLSGTCGKCGREYSVTCNGDCLDKKGKTECPTCGGTGKILETCPLCDGTGEIEETIKEKCSNVGIGSDLRGMCYV